MDRREPLAAWLDRTLTNYRHLPATEVLRLAVRDGGWGQSALLKAGRTIGVQTHRYGRHSDWYPPTATEVDYAFMWQDPERSLIDLLCAGWVSRVEITKAMAADGFGEKAVLSAAKRISVEERKQKSKSGPYQIMWQLPDNNYDAALKIWMDKHRLQPL